MGLFNRFGVSKGVNSKGFSLVELMIVVAIIGVLAAVGIPQFSKFQSKSRQAEVKTNLAALFTMQKAFHTQYYHYTVDLQNVGFGIHGRGLRYDMGFSGSANCGASFVTNAAMTGAPAENAARTVASTLAPPPGVTVDWLYGIPTGVAAGVVCAQDLFTAIAYGNPNTSATVGNNDDQWAIDQNKRLRHTVNGIF